MTLNEFITDAGITITSTQTGNNPHVEDSDRMNNYKVRLRNADGRTMRLYYSKGVGRNGASPTAEEILDCLAMDASGIENAQGFEDWCSEYGYDTDSRRAEKTYKVCQRQAERLQKFLDADRYQVLLWEVERR